MEKIRQNRKVSGMHIGSATLVMIFSVLCLTIFAVLSVVTAANSYTLAQKASEAITAHYEADCRAAEILADIKSSYDGVFVMPDNVDAEIENSAGAISLSYWVDIDENQNLWVKICETDGEIKVLRWEVTEVETWEADQTLNVWLG